MICAELTTVDGAQFITAATSQPADLSTCAVVVLTGNEMGALTLTAFPTQADAATAYVWGFSIVVVCYAAARCIGAVVNFVR